MSAVQVRPFRRDDRDQLTRLVNAHAEAVVPGMSASVNAVLSSLERQSGEFVEDPWVSDRLTLVGARYRRRGVGSWLLGQAADWLRLARVSRLLDYAWLEGTDSGGCSYDEYRAFLPAVGFRELTRTARGWTLTADGGGRPAGAG